MKEVSKLQEKANRLLELVEFEQIRIDNKKDSLRTFKKMQNEKAAKHKENEIDTCERAKKWLKRSYLKTLRRIIEVCE